MTDTHSASVLRAVTVPLGANEAFDLFTLRFGEIKPAEHNLLSAPIAETVLEPHVGGGIVDRAVDGSECRWARILVFDRPHRLVFSWDIDPTWQVVTDPDLTSEVEVRFVADGASTRVEIEHRHLDRHGPGGTSLADALGGQDGWPHYLRRFAELAEQSG